MQYYLPVLIVVLSNTFYHICSKSTPERVNTFAALFVTYAVAAVVSLVLFFVTAKNPDLGAEFRQLNRSTFVLGLAIIGLEAGFMLMYKAGWSVSTGQLVASALLAIVLIFVGRFLYQEPLDPKKLIGIGVCCVGLYLING